MNDQITFLLARLDEDEVRRHAVHSIGCRVLTGAPCGCGVPERMRREVEAKRRILDRHGWLDADYDYGTFPDDTIAALVTVYSNHADYRPQWAPAAD